MSFQFNRKYVRKVKDEQNRPPPLLKVSKYQKHFFLKFHCPKIRRNIRPYRAKVDFCQIFHSFFGQWSYRKNAFEIYWPLLYQNVFRILRGQTERNRSFPVNIPIAIFQFVTISASRFTLTCLIKEHACLAFLKNKVHPATIFHVINDKFSHPARDFSCNKWKNSPCLLVY